MLYFQIYALVVVLTLTLLAMNVSRIRIKERIANGHEHRDLKIANRAHMNTLEHALPYGLLLLALVQAGVQGTVLAVLVFGFLAVKLGHAYSMLASQLRLRQISAGLTYLFELAGCGVLAAALLN